MNNKIPKDSILKKQGFYAALYSCVGILLVIAAVMSFNNYSQAKKIRQESEQSTVDFSQLEDATTSKDRSYLTPADRKSLEDTARKPEAAPTATATPATTAAPAGNNPEGSARPAPTPSQNPAPQTEKPAANPQAEAAPNAAAVENEVNQTRRSDEGQAVIIEPIAPPAPAGENAYTNENVYAEEETFPLTVDESYVELEPDPVETRPVFNEFAEGSRMKWPIVGEILMDFSSDHAIYDKTLDQYRTNNSISISAELGSQVRAAAEGVVKQVTKTVEKGNTVVIDNGNGWQTMYSQLQDGILVHEGDVVKEGQVIGGVASPSIYGVLLGNHLEFAIMKDDAPVDPKNILQGN